MVAKAFSDPTYIYRSFIGWLPITSPDPIKVGSNTFIATVQQGVLVPWDRSMVWAVSRSIEPLPYSFLQPVPTPPMGKLNILTFPAVYKEKVFRNTIGQVYPRGSR